MIKSGPLADGSSPLTRGKLIYPAKRSAGLGLIPAHAGKTVAVVRFLPALEAHPRSRGENLRMCRGGTCPLGSSPLTRGKQVAGLLNHDLLRLIPAHAGKTRRR